MANPYPSAISVSGLNGTVDYITVTLSGFSHTFPDDLGAVVVSPSGIAVLLFSGPGTGTDVTNLELTFDDLAEAALPEEDPLGGLVNGTYQPGLNQWNDDFPAPGPGLNYAFAFSPLLAEDPNGEWLLFIKGSFDGDGGSVANRWSVSFTTSAIPEPSAGLLIQLLFPGAYFCSRSRRRR